MKGGDKPAKKNGGKAKGAPLKPVAYQAEILGQRHEVSGWEDGKWLLAGGARYGFKPLLDDGLGYHGQRLLAVSELRLKDGEWLLDGVPLTKLVEVENEAFRVPWPQRRRGGTSKAAIRPTLRLRILMNHLAGGPYGSQPCYDGTDKECVRAVAWFEGEDEDGDPVLLRDFWPDNSPAAPPADFKACKCCGWSHDDKFTLINIPGKAPIRLDGILSKIVAQVHRAHEEGSAPMLTKNVECGGYGKPSKAFYDLRQSEAREAIFDTSRRGYIALRVSEPGRNKS